ncbi:MAG: hypothetical protein KDA37_03995, partial [Planctomycetales bacterium]|nr:hypothetical protein [Planctomycetales bacterium]
MSSPSADPSEAAVVQASRLRWSIYLLFIAVAVGQWSGRILSVDRVDVMRLEQSRIEKRLEQFQNDLEARGLEADDVDQRMAREEQRLQERLRLQHPMLSSNDRSRWVAIRALVEQHTFEIDELIQEPGWDTIDKVRHQGRDGQQHFYSSKPPLLYILLAGETWAVERLTGWTFADNEYEIIRTVLLLSSPPVFALLLVLVAAIAERFCRTAWAALFTVITAAYGTLLTAFAASLNNHLYGAASAAVALYCWVRIRETGSPRGGWFVLAGLACGFAYATELPSLAMAAAIAVSLLFHAPRNTLLAFCPAMLVVVGAVVFTNWLAHDSLRPPYAHRSEENPEDNWYLYPGSHWENREGIDSGEPSRVTYALHTLVGHHGILSLTPVWALSIFGAGAWLVRSDGLRRELALGVIGLTIVVLVFYLGLRPQGDRNYGGMTSGLRWMFWFTPLWLAVMAPAADWAARTRGRQALAAVLLAFSALSA